MDMNNIVEQIGFIQKEMEKLHRDLEDTIVRGTDSSKTITVLVTGKGVVKDYEFNIFDLGGMGKEKLVNAVVEATNNGLQAAKELEVSRKKEIIGDVNLPDIPGLF